jgi:Na+/melibiose symporter-like transporter
MTVYQINHVRPVTSHLVTNTQNVATQPLRSLQPLQSLPVQKQKFFPDFDGQGRNYFRVIGLLFLFNLTNNMAAPLIPDLLVHKLKLSDGLISIGTSTSTLVVLIVSLFIARITRRTGNRTATAFGAGLLAFQAVALAMAQNAFLYLVAAVIGGIALGILNAAQLSSG